MRVSIMTSFNYWPTGSAAALTYAHDAIDMHVMHDTFTQVNTVHVYLALYQGLTKEALSNRNSL